MVEKEVAAETADAAELVEKHGRKCFAGIFFRRGNSIRGT